VRLRGAVVVITGASSGIGAATAVAFARRGARLELGARRLDRLNTVAVKCRQAGSPEVNVRLLDVGQRAHARAFIAAAIRDHERLDVLVNNAGIGWRRGSTCTRCRFRSAAGVSFRSGVRAGGGRMIT
jgi:NADP-dependent 3-hydroxy acid dehydrogenase YdfG